MTAAASEPPSFVKAPHSCDERSASKHVKLAKGVANAAYSRKRWRHGPSKAQTRRIGDHLRCLERAKDRKAVKRHVAKKRSAQRLYRAYRRITPYRCQRGPYGTWAIPCYIIACESRFSWSAYNSSSAAGPYQIMGFHGRPFPVRSFRDKLEHHRIASRLSLSAWVCA